MHSLQSKGTVGAENHVINLLWSYVINAALKSNNPISTTILDHSVRHYKLQFSFETDYNFYLTILKPCDQVFNL